MVPRKFLIGALVLGSLVAVASGKVGLEAKGPKNANNPPVADAGLDKSVAAGDTITLDGAGSYDSDGDRLNFSWSLVSVPPGSTAQLSDPQSVKPNFVADLLCRCWPTLSCSAHGSPLPATARTAPRGFWPSSSIRKATRARLS